MGKEVGGDRQGTAKGTGNSMRTRLSKLPFLANYPLASPPKQISI